MPLSNREWEDEARLLGLDQRGEILVGLNALENWPAFKENFSETGIFQIKRIIELSLE